MAPNSQFTSESTPLPLPIQSQLPLPEDSRPAATSSQSTPHANDELDSGIDRAVARLNRIAILSKQSILDAWNKLLLAYSSKINRLTTLNARLETEPFPLWLKRTIPQSTLSLVLASVYQNHWDVHVNTKRNEAAYRLKAVTHLHLDSHWDLYLFFGPAAVASRACWLKLPPHIDARRLFHRLVTIRGLGSSYLDQFFSVPEFTAAKKIGPAGAATPSAIPGNTSSRNMEKATTASSRLVTRSNKRNTTLPGSGGLTRSGSSNNLQGNPGSTDMPNHEFDDSAIGDIDNSETDSREGSGVDLNPDMARPSVAAKSAHSTQNALNRETSGQAQPTASSHDGLENAGATAETLQCVLNDIKDEGRFRKIHDQIKVDATYTTVARKDKTESESSIVQLREKTLARLRAIEEQTDGCVDDEED
ncbi:hypothetical protein HER10_EVM0010715 [Colletotrichum scovillei]|uniref:uncharacterized protein n=1 Tax=Colletotrichum scovillei TaxID=1209932 RepID=UPI0015C3526F|nr:uncharacterized protein HER10_EVM0010715 [Colletotrichum scovillei]KAF4772828.1 hypothetical protein HER10_EVM0010715 [Colletotrichum scovillei]